ncbi:Stearoyl-CoA 9-desaturase electron transfer partner [Corynebacterium hansenii]|nr:ferredoxin reductase [Corynebacterium hansenii]WJY99183.1 Stearoyl-CoA 9-desaturase electron transfer partner [Corynebacterium hansenii]
MSIGNRLRGAFRHLSTPLMPDDYTRLVNPLWSKRELRGQIERVSRPAEDVVELVIKPGWGVPADFRAGQYIGVGVRVDGRLVWRSYSLTNAPQSADGMLTVTVKAQEQGRLSQHLVANVTPGTVVRLAAPAGDFHLPEPPPAKLLFITAGSGITPVMSMLRDLERRGGIKDVIHLHSVRDRAGLLFDGELDRLSREQPGYALTVRETGIDGRLSIDEIKRLVPDVADRATYACGPSAMLDELEDGLPGVRTERFTLDRGNTDAQGGVVSFPGRGEIEVDGATTILEAGEKAGIQLPYGCRMGICATCVQQLADGTARDLRTGETHEAGERIRACVCVPAGDVAIEL